MDKLRGVIEQHSRWQDLDLYVERIETFVYTDFSSALENAKSMLETIAREICDDRKVTVTKRSGVNGLVKLACSALGYTGDHHVTQISSALATIGQQMGNLRTRIGVTAHGKTLDQLKERNNLVDDFTRELLIDSTEIIACFLIRGFEVDHGQPAVAEEAELKQADYMKNTEFNDFWDDGFGEFTMGDYVYPASEILFNVDVKAYTTEFDAYKRDKAAGIIE
ncbi:MAG: abortive infection family protein [Alphaproteobacteria bacterium]|jgi:hypothetical protein|nr:abortive infection family protein [Alphaproteobacteria bacterium]